MADGKKQENSGKNGKTLPSEAGGPKDELAAEEEMNATMMAIDLSQLNLDAETKTGIKLARPTDEEIIQEKLEQKKPPVLRFLSRLFRKRGFSAAAEKAPKQPAPFLKRYRHVWLADLTASVKEQVVFYVWRLFLLVFSVYLHKILLVQLEQGMLTHHPARNFYLVCFCADILFVLLALFFSLSPGWIVSCPLSALAVIFTHAALFYHTADSLLFQFNDLAISSSLNIYYVAALGYGLLTAILVAGTGVLWRVFFAFLFSLSLLPVAINLYQHVDLEYSFFGAGFLSGITTHFYQPVFISFHVLMPVLFFALLVFSFFPMRTVSGKAARGFARGLALLVFCLLPLNFSLMQKNRVTHALNLVIPHRLDVGGVEIEVFNQKLGVFTKNFVDVGGDDALSRYRILLKPGQKDGQFLMQVKDQFDFPVKNLSKDDFVVLSDGRPVGGFSLVEKRLINYKVGSYILETVVQPKQPLITWDRQKRSYFNAEHIEFKLADPARIKQVVIRKGGDALLAVTHPPESRISFPLNFFEAGNHELELSVYDPLDQEIFRQTFFIDVQIKPDFTLIIPAEGDTVAGGLDVVLLPQALPNDKINTVSYEIDGKKVHESEGAYFYHRIDTTGLAPGLHELRVSLEGEQGSLSKTASFYQKTSSRKFELTQPDMGAYGKRQVGVAYQAQGADIAGVKVFVNGFPFSDVNIRENRFELPVFRWMHSEIYLTVQATLTDGAKLSDWVQINKGLGVLDLDFNTRTLAFLDYKKIAFLLDASISNLDSWQGREKFKHIKNLVTENEMDAAVKNLNSAYIAFGSATPNYYADCSDVKIFVPFGSYNQVLLRKELEKIKPAGVSSLHAALQKAYALSAEKIYVFADSADSCHKNLAESLNTRMKNNELTPVVVFALGQSRDSDVSQLRDLASQTGGRFYQPESYDLLLKSMLEEIVLSYEIYYQGELITRAPLGARTFSLAPGTYTLKIPHRADVKSIEFAIENNTKTALKVEGKDGKIHVNVSITRL